MATIGRTGVPSLPAFVRRHPAPSFFVSAYLLSWGVWVPMALLRLTVTRGAHPTHVPGLLGPMLAALLVTALGGGREGVRDLLARMVRWRVGVGWWLAALSPLGFLAIAVLATMATGGKAPALARFGYFNGFPEVGPLGVWALLTLVGGYGEEAGWRGFALPTLQRRHGPLAASLIVAVFWALWHAPSFPVIETYRGLPLAALPMFFVGLACGSIVLTWLYNRSGGSIGLVALWHGTFNLASGTEAARGTIAAIVSTLIVLQAAVLVALERRSRAGGGERGSEPGGSR